MNDAGNGSGYIRHEILNRARGIYPDLNKAEQAVLLLLVRADGKLTQRDIAKSEPYLGAHPQFEPYPTKIHTSLRRVRWLVHDLRVNHYVGVISDEKGYWLATTREEVETYLDVSERRAGAQARSHLATVAAMRQAIGDLRERSAADLFKEDDPLNPEDLEDDE